MFNAYLVRQPIFDHDERIVAYELHYRSDGGGPTSPNISSYIDIGLAKLVGSHRAFIKVTRDFIINHGKLPSPSNQLVFAVPENVEADDDVVAAVKALMDENCNIMLDDFDYGQKNRRLLQLAHFAKIDILKRDADQLTKLVSSLRKFPIKLLAGKVETAEQYEYCRELDFDYY